MCYYLYIMCYYDNDVVVLNKYKWDNGVGICKLISLYYYIYAVIILMILSLNKIINFLIISYTLIYSL